MRFGNHAGLLPFLLTLALPWNAWASAEHAYEEAMRLASEGKLNTAVAELTGAELSVHDMLWRERLHNAAILLKMRVNLEPNLPGELQGPSSVLVRQWLPKHPAPQPESRFTVGILATLLPGMGHAWLDRWRDAATVAVLVWPMILLTFWSARRRMGPVTVFFGIVTLWLWSGSVFSAVSLAERGSVETYLLWWQQLWLVSGLPGRPWGFP